MLHPDVSLARASVAPHVATLRLCGFYLPPAAGRPRRLHHAYCCFSLTITSLYLMQECVYAYQVRRDMDKLARVMFLLLCHVTSIVKQIVFHVDTVRIDQLVTGLDDASFSPAASARAARGLLLCTARRARWLQRSFAGAAVLTCTLWAVFPAAARARGLPVHFPVFTGLDYNGPAQFVFVLVYSYYVTTLVGIANTTMDAFMATMLYQCQTQLRILRMNFESLAERAIEKANTQSEDRRHESLSELFLECLTHYKKINRTLGLLQDVFGNAIVIQFGIGGWILCMAAYKLVSLSVLSIEFASNVLFIICILTELLLYCYYGNEVKVESDRMVESIYVMQWLGTPLRFQRSLLVMMERAKRPLQPAAGLVIPLSLETFVKIMKSSYTLYAVLRQTK